VTNVVRLVLTQFCETFIERISRPEAIALQRLAVGQVDRFPEIWRVFFEHAPAINSGIKKATRL
jgi:hypothetical protein